MIRKIVLPVLIVFLLSASCKKNSGSQTTIEIKFSADALAWVQLPLNRYFIYKDSATGTLDSVVVTQSSVERKYQPSTTSGLTNPEYYYQMFSLTLSKYISGNAQDWFYGIASAFNNNVLGGPVGTDLAAVFLVEKNRATNADKFYVFVSTNSIVTQSNAYSSFDVLGKNYSNVKSFTTANGPDQTNPNYLKTIYYWANNIGIIKREVRTSTLLKTDLLVKNN